MPDSSSAFLVDFDGGDAATSVNHAAILTQLVHELSQPLGTIDSIAYLLRMVLPPDDQRTREQLGHIVRLVDSMNTTLADALYYLRTEPARPETVDLHELLREALAERGPEARPLFRLELGDEPAMARLDAGQGRHLVRGLVRVFRAFTGRCSEVVVSTYRDEPLWMIEFNAPGLETTRQEIERLFEPFGEGFQEGIGLTLASARQILESNGGRISAGFEDGRGLRLRGSIPKAC